MQSVECIELVLADRAKRTFERSNGERLRRRRNREQARDSVALLSLLDFNYETEWMQIRCGAEVCQHLERERRA